MSGPFPFTGPTLSRPRAPSRSHQGSLFLAALGSAACLAGGDSWVYREAHCLWPLGLYCWSLFPRSSSKTFPAVAGAWLGAGRQGNEHEYPTVPLRLDHQPRCTEEETEAQRAQMTCRECLSHLGVPRDGAGRACLWPQVGEVMDSNRSQMAGPEHPPILFYAWKQSPQRARAGPRSHGAPAAESAGKPGVPNSQTRGNAGA